jgi:ribonuclease E
MVLESNRELVLRRLTECLGRDRTKHQVAEVTSLGLVQMTRKRVGEGLLEAFSEPCEVCRGRGVIIHAEPVDKPHSHDLDTDDDDRPKAKRKRGGAKKAAAAPTPEELEAADEQRRIALAAMAAIHRAAHPDDELDEDSITDAQIAAAQADPELMAAQADAELVVEDSIIEPVERVEAVEVAEPAEPIAPVAPVRTGQRRRRAASRPAGPPAAATGT